MRTHLQRDLDRLRKDIRLLGALVNEATDRSIQAIAAPGAANLEEIEAAENRINDFEIEIEDECLKLLALHQPVATDLRYIIAVLKVNKNLERMGDQAVNIANRVPHLLRLKPLSAPLDFPLMGEVARRMAHLSVESLLIQDVETARKVLQMDDEVDEMHAAHYGILEEAMRTDPEVISTAVCYLSISINLERIGDLSCNIAEEALFLDEGEIQRHLS